MLYHAFDLQRAALNNISMASNVINQIYAASPLKHCTAARYVAGGSRIIDSLTRHRRKPEWGIDSIEKNGETIPVSIETVAHRPFCDLVRFSAPTSNRQSSVLLAAPLSGHYATLLRETVRELLLDHDVYVTDWICASQVSIADGNLPFDTYIEYLIDFIEGVDEPVNLVAVCQPGPASLAAVTIMESTGSRKLPNSLVLMGSPIDTSASKTEVVDYARSHPLSWFEQNVLHRVPVWHAGGQRRVYPGFIQLAGFIMMNPQRHIEAHRKALYSYIKDEMESFEAFEKFYDEYFSTLDLDGKFYLDTIDIVFQRNLLGRGDLTWRGMKVDPAAITKTPLMTIEGEKDDISPPGHTVAAQGLCTSLPENKRKITTVANAGHYGIFSGSRWRKTRPEMTEFFAAHQK